MHLDESKMPERETFKRGSLKIKKVKPDYDAIPKFFGKCGGFVSYGLSVRAIGEGEVINGH